jgi:hypothetical protein
VTGKLVMPQEIMMRRWELFVGPKRKRRTKFVTGIPFFFTTPITLRSGDRPHKGEDKLSQHAPGSLVSDVAKSHRIIVH